MIIVAIWWEDHRKAVSHFLMKVTSWVRAHMFTVVSITFHNITVKPHSGPV